jgi:hypothetical protein
LEKIAVCSFYPDLATGCKPEDEKTGNKTGGNSEIPARFRQGLSREKSSGGPAGWNLLARVVSGAVAACLSARPCEAHHSDAISSL